MKTFVNYLYASLAAIALLVSSTAIARCQDLPEPSIVISIANTQEQLGDISYIMESAGMAQFEFFFKVQADSYLKGVNEERPAGALIYFDESGEDSRWMAFVPVDNMDDVLNTISRNIGEVEEKDDYTIIVNDDGDEIFVRESEGFAFMADNADMLKLIPSDAAGELENLPARYNIAAKVFGQRIPESMRDQALDLIREGAERQMDQLALEDDDELAAELRETNFENQMAFFEKMINETESLVVGMAADKETNSLYFDMEMLAMAGSEFAEEVSGMSTGEPTRFGGFVSDDAAFNMNMCIGVNAQDMENYRTSVDSILDKAVADLRDDSDLSDSQADVAEKAMRDIAGVIEETIANGVIDGAVLLKIEPGDLNFALGVLTENPGKVEQTVKDVVAELEKEMPVDELVVNLNVGELRGTTLHELLITVPDDEEEARRVFGESITLLVAIGQEEVYLAGGNNPLTLLEKSMEASADANAEKPAPIQWNLYLEPILRMASDVEGEPMVEEMADKLAEAGNDRISISANVIENGMSMRFDIQDGLLQLIGVAAQNFGAGFGPAEDDFQPVPNPVPNP